MYRRELAREVVARESFVKFCCRGAINVRPEIRVKEWLRGSALNPVL
jgi:hypothetical protein